MAFGNCRNFKDQEDISFAVHLTKHESWHSETTLEIQVFNETDSAFSSPNWQSTIQHRNFRNPHINHQKLVQAGMHPRADPPLRMILGEGKNPGKAEQCLAIGSPAKG